MSTPAHQCIYCPAELVPPPAGGTLPDNAATRDHVFPRAILRESIGPHDPHWYRRNKVWCCARCNWTKAGMHPLEWLARIGDYQPGRDRLANRLVALGVPRDAVFA